MAETHTILGGKVHVYKRPNSTYWQCATYLASKNRRTSTKEESLSKAKEIAEDWYLQLRGKLRAGEVFLRSPNNRSSGGDLPHRRRRTVESGHSRD